MSPFLVNGSTVISSVTRVREGNSFSYDMTGSYRSALSPRDRTVLASERSNRIVLPTITSRTTVMTATLTTSWALSARSLWTKLSTLKCATVHTSHKVTHVALPNPDRSNRVAVAKRLSQVRFRPCKLITFINAAFPPYPPAKVNPRSYAPTQGFSAALDPMIALGLCRAKDDGG